MIPDASQAHAADLCACVELATVGAQAAEAARQLVGDELGQDAIDFPIAEAVDVHAGWRGSRAATSRRWQAWSGSNVPPTSDGSGVVQAVRDEVGDSAFDAAAAVHAAWMEWRTWMAAAPAAVAFIPDGTVHRGIGGALQKFLATAFQTDDDAPTGWNLYARHSTTGGDIWVTFGGVEVYRWTAGQSTTGPKLLTIPVSTVVRVRGDVNGAAYLRIGSSLPASAEPSDLWDW